MQYNNSALCAGFVCDVHKLCSGAFRVWDKL